MVRAILDGRKTQTRRVVKLRLDNTVLVHRGICVHITDGQLVEYCPYGQPGDRLWVRETWAPVSAGEDAQNGRGTLYRADPVFDSMQAGDFAWKWKPSIHMPRWASRLTLELTAVRVERIQDCSEERIQDCSEEDAKAEGIEGTEYGRGHFANLWDSLNARRGYGWYANPWVWVLTFRRAASPTTEREP